VQKYLITFHLKIARKDVEVREIVPLAGPGPFTEVLVARAMAQYYSRDESVWDMTEVHQVDVTGITNEQ